MAEPLRNLPRHIAGGPCPLKIKATQMTANIQHFTHKIEPRLCFYLHGLGTDGVSIDTTQRYFGGTIAFRSRWLQVPGINLPSYDSQLGGRKFNYWGGGKPWPP